MLYIGGGVMPSRVYTVAGGAAGRDRKTRPARPAHGVLREAAIGAFSGMSRAEANATMGQPPSWA